MKLLCLTERSTEILVVIQNEKEYTIADCTHGKYMREQILGRNCREPKEEMPLEIYLTNDKTLTTSKIKKIRRIP